MKKKLFSLALALALCLGLTAPVFAAEVRIVKVPVPAVGDYKSAEYHTGPFHEGLATLWYSYKLGFIDKSGKVVIPPKYDDAGDFSEGFARVQKNNKWGFIDKTGKEITSFQYSGVGDFSEGMAVVVKDEKHGYIDKTGKEVVPCQYNDAWGFSQGLAVVEKGGKSGFIDYTGKEIIPFQYDDAYSFSEGLAPVKQGGKWGFIDKTGEVVVDFTYDEAGSFGNGLAPVKQGGKWGYINKAGKLVIPCNFDGVGYFSQGLAVVVQNDKFGYIDTTGKLIIPCKYGDAAPFSEGFAAVKAYDGLAWGYVDKTGKEVVPPKLYTESGITYGLYDSLLGAAPSFSDGYARVGAFYYGGDIPKDFVDTFYFALTVDAKVSDWAREQVDLAAAKGLMPDVLGDDFTANITRAEFAAVAVELYEAMSGDTAPAPGENPFKDTDDPVVIQANALGIVNGKGDGVFAPADPVTRQEAALMLSRVYIKLGGELPKVEATTFADNGDVAAWARDAVAFMSGREIVNGVGDNRFAPTGSASIEQALIIALRMIENLDVEY